MTMFEVLVPTFQDRFELRDDFAQTLSIRAFGDRAHTVFQFLFALLAGPFVASLEVVPQKIKTAFLCRVHHPRFLRMQFQSGLCRPVLRLAQRLLCFCLAPTEDDEIVRVAHHLPTPRDHQLVERVEIDVAQQRRDHRPLWRARLRRRRAERAHHLLLQERVEQLQHSSVGNLRRHPLTHFRVWDGVEVAFQIRIHYECVSFVEQLLDPPQRILTAASWAESVAVRCESHFKDRLYHVAQRGLRHAVANRWNPKRSAFTAARLGNPDPPHRLRDVSAVTQLFGEPREVRFQITFVMLNRLMIHACRSFVGADFRPRRSQVRQRVDLINQAVPFATSDSVRFQSGQHPWRPDTGFDPLPRRGVGVSARVSHLGQWEQCCLPYVYFHVSTFLCSLRSTPITEFLCYYGHSDSCAAGSSRARPMNTCFVSAQVSLFNTRHLPDHSAVNHPLPPGPRFNTLPLSVAGFRSLSERSGLRLCTAGSSRSAGRITFVILRTDRSPPVAPHLVSRRRSYLWLQAGERLPEEDLHLSNGARSQARGPHRFQRAVADCSPLGSPERLGAIRMLAVDKQIIQARPGPEHLISINAPPTETARWKRCVPRLAPINALIAKVFYMRTLHIRFFTILSTEVCAIG